MAASGPATSGAAPVGGRPAVPPRAVQEPGDRIADQAAAGGIVEVGADQQAVLQRDEDVGGPFGVGVAVGDEQVPQQLAEPAPVLGDGLAHRMGRVGILGRSVDKRAAAETWIAPQITAAPTGYTLRDGKVTEGVAYFDPRRLLELQQAPSR